MKPIDPAELSALLDGELPADRAEEVRRAIAQDPALRRQYDRLAGMDADFRACASAAVFRPQVSIPAAASVPELGIVPLAILMVVVRAAAKLLPAALGIGVQIVVLVLIVGWVMRRIVRASEEEARRVAAAASAGTA